jgi:hypothetical protein
VCPGSTVVDRSTRNHKSEGSFPSTATGTEKVGDELLFQKMGFATDVIGAMTIVPFAL